MKRMLTTLACCAAVVSAAPAYAHFQMIYTPEMALEEGGKIPLALVFTHPFEAGHTMDMGMPEQFFVIRSRGENAPQKTDLLKTLKPITWTSLTNSGKAWETEYAVRGGDYTFCLVPEPYYEPEEEGYIKQSTKVIVNVGGEPPRIPMGRVRAAVILQQGNEKVYTALSSSGIRKAEKRGGAPKRDASSP